MRRNPCSGSKWMSEALRFTASLSSASTSRTTGWLYSSKSAASERADLVEGNHVGGVRHRDQERLLVGVVAHRQHVIAARHVLGDECDRRRVDDGVLEVDRHLAERLGED